MRIFGMFLLWMGTVGTGWGDSRFIQIPMFQKSATTFYVNARIAGLEADEWMVDTGSSYTTINERTLERLLASGGAAFLREQTGTLANGAELSVPVYRVKEIQVGQRCRIAEIEVAVVPGHTRQLLGLNALRRASPFVFSVDPPAIAFSNCL